MPRRDLTQERTAQILDAFERCVLQYGLEGSSLERVAEEAGVKRSILRHYIGNRSALISALVERLVKKYSEQLEKLVAYLPRKDRAQKLLAWLFSPTPSGMSEESIIFGKLVVEAGQYPKIQELLGQSMEEFIQVVATQLNLAFPQASRKNCWTVASGIIALYSNYEALAPLQLPDTHRKTAYECARRLIDTLEPLP